MIQNGASKISVLGTVKVTRLNSQIYAYFADYQEVSVNPIHDKSRLLKAIDKL